MNCTTSPDIGEAADDTASPLVSVIMIFLNAEQFISEAIESVFCQIYTHWELILVDDGSTDSSTRIAHEFAEKRPTQIMYTYHKDHANLGMSASRNQGIQCSRGEYISFLDADDVYLPEKLSRQVDVLNREPDAAMVYGPSQYWFSWSGTECSRGDRLREVGVPTDSLYPPPVLVREFLSKRAHSPATCGVLVRRRAIEAVGGFNSEFRGMNEDVVFFFKLCLLYPVYVSGECHALYRQQPQSYTQKMLASGSLNWSQPNEFYLVFLSWIREHLLSQGISDPAIWSALRRELRPYRYPQIYRCVTWIPNKRRLRRLSSSLRARLARARILRPVRRG